MDIFNIIFHAFFMIIIIDLNVCVM